MILVDTNQVIIGTLMSQTKGESSTFKDENLLRHIIISTILSIKKKFSKDYGEMILCFDGYSWRKNIFSYYKENRKIARDNNTSIDWNEFYRLLNIIKEEIKENLPYKCLHVQNAEADDIIYSLCKKYHEKEKILVVSSDKDFAQLQQFRNVEQYSPIHKTKITVANWEYELFSHIARGDSSDGIPNILSDEDTFVSESKRQKPLRENKIKEWYSNNMKIPSEYEKRFNINKTLIDLSEIPQSLYIDIENTFINTNAAEKTKVLPYLMSKQMKLLINDLTEF